jgi:hypothetical protein
MRRGFQSARGARRDHVCPCGTMAGVTSSSSAPSPPSSAALESVAAEIETHVGRSGWERPPTLFALVRTAQFAAQEPEAAARLGLEETSFTRPEALTPIEQDGLPTGELDEILAQIAWPESVAGCGLSQEIVFLPPSAEQDISTASDEPTLNVALTHPDRREARLVVTVLRDGSSAAVLRLRATGNSEGTEGTDDLLTGADLAPNLVAALIATLQ